MTCKVSGSKGWETGGVGDDGIKEDARQALGWEGLIQKEDSDYIVEDSHVDNDQTITE